MEDAVGVVAAMEKLVVGTPWWLQSPRPRGKSARRTTAGPVRETFVPPSAARLPPPRSAVIQPAATTASVSLWARPNQQFDELRTLVRSVEAVEWDEEAAAAAIKLLVNYLRRPALQLEAEECCSALGWLLPHSAAPPELLEWACEQLGTLFGANTELSARLELAVLRTMEIACGTCASASPPAPAAGRSPR